MGMAASAAGGATTQRGGLPEDEVCSELFLFLFRVRQPVRSADPGT